MPTKTFNYPFNAETPEGYSQALSNLNTKLESIKKQVSYFDCYNISGAVTNADEFSAQLNNLPLGQSLVVNTSPFTYNGESYSSGDVIIKDSLGGVYHIKSQTGGVFYPQKIEGSSGSYSIHFGFSGSAPTVANSSNIKTAEDGTITYDSSAPFAENMTYGGFTNIEKSNIYGIWAEMEHEDTDGTYYRTFSYVEEDEGEAVKPHIQFFLCSDDGTPEEQVFIDYSLYKDGTEKTWTISIPDDVCPVGLYVKVK